MSFPSTNNLFLTISYEIEITSDGKILVLELEPEEEALKFSQKMMSVDDFHNYEEMLSSSEKPVIPMQDRVFFSNLPQVKLIRKSQLAIIN